MSKKIPTYLCCALGFVFILSAMLKAVNVFAFGNIIELFCGLLGMDVFYGYGKVLAVLICAGELFLGLLSLHPGFQRVVCWIFPVVLGYFTYITFINHTRMYAQIESCGCFGEIVHLSAAATFYKNVVLFLLSIGLCVLSVRDRSEMMRLNLSCIIKNVYVWLCLLMSFVLPLFSLACMNRLGQSVYLILYLSLCLVIIAVASICLMKRLGLNSFTKEKHGLANGIQK